MPHRLLRAVTALAVALGLSGCHEAICGNPDGFDYAFELVGGVYRCKAVPERPRPQAVVEHEPEPALTDQRVTFDGSRSHTPDGTIESYGWDLDADGRFDDGSGPTAQTSFARPGEHGVALRVRDSEGRRDRADLTVEILDSAEAVDPIAVLEADRTFVFTGGEVTFDPAGRTTRTAKSPCTSGTSTATATTSRPPAPPSRAGTATPRPASSPRGCG